jgi:outer membrane murein-binding lipoprotein Lpp
MRRMLPIAMASAALLVAGCGGSRPMYFVGADGSTVALIKWSGSQTGRARGIITEDTLAGAAPAQTVHVQSVQVTVTIKGSDVLFAGSGLDGIAGATVTGRLSGSTLRITAPGASGFLQSAVLRPATSAAYNSDLANLRQHVTRDNTAARQVQPRPQNSAAITSDQQQVSSDVSTLQTDAQSLTSDMSQMNTDVQQVSADLAQLTSDAANGQGQSCDNVATVDNDASTVDGDGTTVGNDSTTVTSDISTVQSDISQLSTDLATLAKDGGSVAGSPSPQTVISQEQAALTSALSQANSYISTVNGYLQQAYTTANNLAGSTCGGSG